MAKTGKLPGHLFQNGMLTDVARGVSQNNLEGSQQFRSNWYLCRREIEDNSPSKKDGIDLKKETQLRKLYCAFLQDIGMKLKVPQETIAAAMMLCHRFFLRQSHAKNEWQTIATVSMFLASKVEETPRLLMDVIIVAYETMYRRDPVAAHRIKQKEVYEKQKERILIGETLLLCTIGFDLNIQHPYKPLMAAAKRLKIAQNVWKAAWNYVNDWLRTTLCLQYKPHYIAAGSMFLAAKFLKVKLPSENGMVWWQQFDVTPQRLEEVTQQMIKILNENRRAEVPCTYDKARQTPAVTEKAVSTSPHSSALSGSVLTNESSHVPDKEIEVVTSAHSVNPDLPCSHVLVRCNAPFAGKGELQFHLHAKENGVSACANSVNHDSPGCDDLVHDNILLSNKGDVQCSMSDCGSAHSVVEDSGRFNEVTHDQAAPLESDLLEDSGRFNEVTHGQAIPLESDFVEDSGRFNEVTRYQATPLVSDQVVRSESVPVRVGMGLSEMDKERIRAKLKRRRWERATDKMAAGTCDIGNYDAWIESELDNGIDVKELSEKKLRWSVVPTDKMAAGTCDVSNYDAWIESELENGIDVKEPSEKKLSWSVVRTDKMVASTCDVGNYDAWIENELEKGIDVKEP
ncbi:hypothetical protein MRB53_018052 [Persea americana]|uniref:Uncharacterized protein n=1 Tax=Persea americana TaxID=3435 RepID=A0ACC2M7I0_PERAE|nr:hypothetical protein MRB53_018052 [Persea americana]